MSKLNVRKDSGIQVGEKVTCYIDPTLPAVKQSVNETVTIIGKMATEDGTAYLAKVQGQSRLVLCFEMARTIGRLIAMVVVDYGNMADRFFQFATQQHTARALGFHI